MSQHEIARLMVGREVLFQVRKNAAKPGKVLLETTDLCAQSARGTPALRGVNLQVRAGRSWASRVSRATVSASWRNALRECGRPPVVILLLRHIHRSHGCLPAAGRSASGTSLRIGSSRACADLSLWETLIVGNQRKKYSRSGAGPALPSAAHREFSRQLIADYSIKIGDHRRRA